MTVQDERNADKIGNSRISNELVFIPEAATNSSWRPPKLDPSTIVIDFVLKYVSTRQ